MKLRHRPDGQCFQCNKIKKELMEDPDDLSKPIWIYCDECYKKIYEDYLLMGYHY